MNETAYTLTGICAKCRRDMGKIMLEGHEIVRDGYIKWYFRTPHRCDCGTIYSFTVTPMSIENKPMMEAFFAKVT